MRKRNPIARILRTPMFRKRVERNRKTYTRKAKHEIKSTRQPCRSQTGDLA